MQHVVCGFDSILANEKHIVTCSCIQIRDYGSLFFLFSYSFLFSQECEQEYDGSNLENKLLIHYELNGNTLDSGPNMIHGVNNGGEVDSDRFGAQSAYLFDGNSNIVIPHDDSYKVQFPISVSTWVKWGSDSPQKNGVFSTNFEQDNYHGVFMLRLAATGNLFFGYGTGTGGITLENRRAIISDSETDLNKWYHIVGVINGPNDFLLYVNGCEDTFSYTGEENPIIAYNESDGFLGKLDNSTTVPSNDLIGALDDFYLWNRSITEEEVLYLYDRFEVPSIDLGDTYTIPEGEDNVMVEVPTQYTDVRWSDGQTGNSATFTQEGTYQVEAFYDCHLVCDEFEVVKEIVLPPAECGFMESFDSHCGTSQYKCVLNEDIGGPKYYFEGELTLPDGYELCGGNINDFISSTQTIDIFYYTINGNELLFRAFATIIDDSEYEEDGLILELDICEDEETACIRYKLPSGSCNEYYDCTIDYRGLSLMDSKNINMEYCIYLHELSCEENYSIEVYLQNSVDQKLIYESALTATNDYTCIQIPISVEDFLSNHYNCIELIITEVCAEVSCSRYDCNLFNVAQLEGQGMVSNEMLSERLNNNFSKPLITNVPSVLKLYPNPTTGIFNIELDSQNEYRVFDTNGRELLNGASGPNMTLEVDISKFSSGVYYIFFKGETGSTLEKILKI